MRLVIDSSRPVVCLGFMDENGSWLWTKSWEGSTHQQSKLLLSCLEEAFEVTGYSRKDVTSIAVGQGPGSYTGLRVGLTLAKVWALAEVLPLYVFSSDALASAETSDLQVLSGDDFTFVEDLDLVEPIYANDHFQKKTDADS